ncbi:MAG: 50S ribosomal protein L28 [Acidobacteria bacterium]|nr:50S ribosomal protein L28 [Acidobacteriota bacterium]
MAMMCEMCGKKPVFGNRISHAHNVSSRRWLPNVQSIRVKVGTTVRRMRVCTRCIRSGKIQKAAR